MTHLTDNTSSLQVRSIVVQDLERLTSFAEALTDVCVIVLPPHDTLTDEYHRLIGIEQAIEGFAGRLSPSATLVVIGEVSDLVQVQAVMPSSIRYQHWVALRRSHPKALNHTRLPSEHFGALIYTRYKQALRHSRIRIAYTYCPVCDKTTKDYGGKKHTYHKEGTLISDVWSDEGYDLSGDLDMLLTRLADFLNVETYTDMLVLDCRGLAFQRETFTPDYSDGHVQVLSDEWINRVIDGDSLAQLRQLPSNSIDFAFADPPYNLQKSYLGYRDDLDIQDYFSWCDEWIHELARVLKPGRTLALLNIPLWAVRHFLFLETELQFQNWIVWDALAYPVRLIMPAHYAILCFSKGYPRPLPGFIGASESQYLPSAPITFDALKPLADNYCLRQNCVATRIAAGIDDRGQLTDLWRDIHRLKHNSRRVDHPCQLPPHLMYRLITIFSMRGEVVLDPFNGAGTTTLAAHQLGRRYLGIDISESYCMMARERHAEIQQGLDPFRKAERLLTSKNSPVPRLEKQEYKVPKKTLQLEVRRVAQLLGHLPTRDELIEQGQYPIEYYDKYFVSWGEVCAAARHAGMSEKRNTAPAESVASVQQLALW